MTINLCISDQFGARVGRSGFKTSPGGSQDGPIVMGNGFGNVCSRHVAIFTDMTSGFFIATSYVAVCAEMLIRGSPI